jgi:hypothetical protein
MNHPLLIKISLGIILTGVPFLAWYYMVDGVYTNKPIEYTLGVDSMGLLLTKNTWEPGEMVTLQTSFCKVRPSTAVVQWTLSNNNLTYYPERNGRVVPVGCYPEEQVGDARIASEIEELPLTAQTGCDHYFTATIKRDIGGGRIRTEVVKTENFCVIDGADELFEDIKEAL